MIRMVKWVFALAVLALVVGPASAWNAGGHMATGAVAYRVLKADSPATIPKVIAILKQNPRYLEKWKAEIEDLDDDADPDEYLFMVAARWADDVRPDERFYPHGGHKELNHYINKPIVQDNTPASVMIPEPADINIIRAYQEFLEILKTETDEKKRSVALCWVIHLIGDAHQPLHTAVFFSELFNHGDRGGTHFYVRQTGTSSAASLHTIWDGLVTQKSKYNDNKRAVIVMMAWEGQTAADLVEERKVVDVEKWIGESFALAKDKAYKHEGAFIEGGKTESTAKVLPEGYMKAAAPIAKRRGVLAGYRMAEVLKTALAN